MGRFFLRVALAFAALLLVLGVAAPWLLYELGLSLGGTPPQPPLQHAFTSEQSRVWEQARGEPPLQSLNPYGFVWRLLVDDGQPKAGERVAYWVAREHNARQDGLRGLSWQLANAALTIWLSRHWSAAELATAALPVVDRDQQIRARRTASTQP